MTDKNTVLSLENVSVRYRLQDSRATADILRRIMGKSPRSNEFWALRNISFTLQKGDMLGVIGKNGAGKSTLMKAISGTLSPASGSIEKHGRLCALLELGAGFDRDMTVKENVYLRGALLGYDKEYIDKRYDDMIEFAQMREFESNPFRTLSSGMKSRIAFSIASLIEPDIIILDEIFAVGDGDFKKKSQQRMQEIISSGETTALMVSHSLPTVIAQCNKVLWLDRGRMIMFGDPAEVCSAYKKYLDTGVLPETETDAAAAPVSTPPVKKHGLAYTLAFIAMFLVLVAGCFVWSQYDLIHAYSLSRSAEPAVLLENAGDCHRQLGELLGVDSSGWELSALDDCVQQILDEKMSYTDAAKQLLSASGISPDDKLSLAAAKLAAVRRVGVSRLDGLTEDILAGPDAPAYARENVSRLRDMEEDCSDAVQDVITELRSYLRKSGLPEETADRVWSAYVAEKTQLEAYFFARLNK